MQSAILETLQKSKNIIISPDVDGFMSAELLSRKFDSVVVGTYDKNILCISDDVRPEECLFVDCDMNTKEFVSIGNHMRIEKDNMADTSFNPNRFLNTKIRKLVVGVYKKPIAFNSKKPFIFVFSRCKVFIGNIVNLLVDCFHLIFSKNIIYYNMWHCSKI